MRIYVNLNRKSRYLIIITLLLSVLMECGSNAKETDNLIVDRENNQISFTGTIYPKRYNTRKDRANGHHLLVWSGGGNARKALINTKIPDIDILETLKQTGAIPGNNLTPETWTDRSDPESPEPDKRVEGTRIYLTVEWDGKKVPIHEILLDTTEIDIDIHVGGHSSLIPVWKSGCITCLFSCPGGRTSNAAYTIRDQHHNRHSFSADIKKLPLDGTPVTVWMQIRKNK